MHKSTPNDYIIIEPTQSLWRLGLKEIWDYRDLLFLLVRRDFVSRYTQTILGPVWFIIQPIVMTLVFTVIFGSIAGISTQGTPGTLFYLTGLLGWNYFQQTFTGTSNTFVANAPVFQKVYFPRLVAPISVALSNMASLAIQLGTLTAFYLVYSWRGLPQGVHANESLVLLPFIVIHIAALALAVGLWMSALTAKYRDLTNLGGLIIQLWMYATPIIYPLSKVPQKWRWLIEINPMTAPIEAIKYMWLNVGEISAATYTISIAITAALLISGIILFNSIGRRFVDTV